MTTEAEESRKRELTDDRQYCEKCGVILFNRCSMCRGRTRKATIEDVEAVLERLRKMMEEPISRG